MVSKYSVSTVVDRAVLRPPPAAICIPPSLATIIVSLHGKRDFTDVAKQGP